MTLWWIASAALLLVVVPVLALILNRLLRPALAIKAYADDITISVSTFPGSIDRTVGELVTTQKLAAAARIEVQQYAQTLERML